MTTNPSRSDLADVCMVLAMSAGMSCRHDWSAVIGGAESCSTCGPNRGWAGVCAVLGSSAGMSQRHDCWSFHRRGTGGGMATGAFADAPRQPDRPSAIGAPTWPCSKPDRDRGQIGQIGRVTT